ncbi:hypothetical protein [uncultured Fibrobacter sp.]|uniref:hypothetical protein n=1 Tax=uncultured Fibrobacter sp. TaxID=261512 RepID=UPI00262BD245|nr:hypothetical protein [uncultured Fibrobacter sp.]
MITCSVAAESGLLYASSRFFSLHAARQAVAEVAEINTAKAVAAIIFNLFMPEQ